MGSMRSCHFTLHSNDFCSCFGSGHAHGARHASSMKSAHVFTSTALFAALSRRSRRDRGISPASLAFLVKNLFRRTAEIFCGSFSRRPSTTSTKSSGSIISGFRLTKSNTSSAEAGRPLIFAIAFSRSFRIFPRPKKRARVALYARRCACGQKRVAVTHAVTHAVAVAQALVCIAFFRRKTSGGKRWPRN